LIQISNNWGNRILLKIIHIIELKLNKAINSNILQKNDNNWNSNNSVQTIAIMHHCVTAAA
jgi:hypothetical protein